MVKETLGSGRMNIQDLTSLLTPFTNLRYLNICSNRLQRRGLAFIIKQKIVSGKSIYCMWFLQKQLEGDTDAKFEVIRTTVEEVVD